VTFACPATDDFFRSRIDHMIDLRHPLAVLASRMPWQEIEARVAQVFSRKGRAGAALPDLDLFGEQVQRVAVASNAGRPRVPLRIMISLLYLKHAFNESDEGVVERWRDTPRWQYFSGCAYDEDRLPCDATTLVKFRQLLGEEGVEELLAQTLNVAAQLKIIEPQELTRVIVDSTVQEKAVAHPTDSRLLEVARTKLVAAAKEAGIALKQTFAKEGRDLNRKAGRYAHARQWGRMRRAIKRQGTIVGRLSREIERKATVLTQAIRPPAAPRSRRRAASRTRIRAAAPPQTIPQAARHHAQVLAPRCKHQAKQNHFDQHAGKVLYHPRPRTVGAPVQQDAVAHDVVLPQRPVAVQRAPRDLHHLVADAVLQDGIAHPQQAVALRPRAETPLEIHVVDEQAVFHRAHRIQHRQRYQRP